MWIGEREVETYLFLFFSLGGLWRLYKTDGPFLLEVVGRVPKPKRRRRKAGELKVDGLCRSGDWSIRCKEQAARLCERRSDANCVIKLGDRRALSRAG